MGLALTSSPHIAITSLHIQPKHHHTHEGVCMRNMAPPTSPSQASLTGLLPELRNNRNNIYHLVAEEIDEISIIGRRVNKSLLSRLYNESITGLALWKAVSKHSLSQTCKQLRLEFDPIHQHRAFTTRYLVTTSNWRTSTSLLMPRFSAAVSSIPSLLAHLRNENGLRPTRTIRFQLNKYAWDSVEALQERLRTDGYLANPFNQFKSLKSLPRKKLCSTSVTHQACHPRRKRSG